MKTIAKRYDHGYKLEVRMGPVPSPEDERGEQDVDAD